MLCLSGYLPLNEKVVHERTEESIDTPVFMAHGRQDHVVPFVRAEQSRDILKELGYTIEWHDYPMQHSLCFEEVQDISAWLKKVLA
jgi:phospholipase/carboxylesterase